MTEYLMQQRHERAQLRSTPLRVAPGDWASCYLNHLHRGVTVIMSSQLQGEYPPRRGQGKGGRGKIPSTRVIL